MPTHSATQPSATQPSATQPSAVMPDGDAVLSNAPTLLAPDSGPRSSMDGAMGPSSGRSTVLPRIDGDGEILRLVSETRTRYEPVKLLGSGGMGEVVLVNDHDIARSVAIKRLLPEMKDPALLARFVDEIRTVGRLEHPNIVPIHDVGLDELGRYFFVMKYVEGETLESIIKKLAAGDLDYHRKYTFELRIEIFIAVLQALSYAHAHGVVHRDVKPANVMVGRYGEVVLMDWGIAKPIAARRDFAKDATGTIGEPESTERGRMYATCVGSLIGTPAYMSPEQARGANDTIDARSDLYSACVLFHELLTLKHYLEGKTTTDDLLQAVIAEIIPHSRLLGSAEVQEEPPPRELVHFLERGLAKDPAERFQSAEEMIDWLQGILEGKLHVQCHVTLTKRLLREVVRMVDRRPNLMFLALLGVVAGVLFAGVTLVRMVVA
jgi:serine/threonine-protein kinase